MKLTVKQQKFADEYIICGNATEAALRAGYSKKTAKDIACENLAKPNLKEYIEKRLEEMKSQKTADGQEVLEYLTSVMRGETKAEVVVVTGDGDGFSSVEHVEKAPDERERLKAAELLGKRFSLFTEQIKLTGDVGVEIINDIPKNTD